MAPACADPSALQRAGWQVLGRDRGPFCPAPSVEHGRVIRTSQNGRIGTSQRADRPVRLNAEMGGSRMMYGWDPGLGGLVLLLLGVILAGAVLWLDFRVVNDVAHTRNR
jgi:hypothetical protein